jgi:hypothetical protein
MDSARATSPALPVFHPLSHPACIVKIEMLAQHPAQRGAISVDLAGELAANERDRFGLPQGSFDLVTDVTHSLL